MDCWCTSTREVLRLTNERVRQHEIDIGLEGLYRYSYIAHNRERYMDWHHRRQQDYPHTLWRLVTTQFSPGHHSRQLYDLTGLGGCTDEYSRYCLLGMYLMYSSLTWSLRVQRSWKRTIPALSSIDLYVPTDIWKLLFQFTGDVQQLPEWESDTLNDKAWSAKWQNVVDARNPYSTAYWGRRQRIHASTSHLYFL